MLGRNDRLDDVGNIVYVGQGFYAEEDVVKRLLGRMGGIFGGAYDCSGALDEFHREAECCLTYQRGA